jgi:putative transposase
LFLKLGVIIEKTTLKFKIVSDKFLNKYRIPSARAEWWDYSNDAACFITICTAGRIHYFGEIDNISEIGKIVESEWLKTPDIRPDMNITLDAFVVMPNHFHAIIIIGKNEYNDCKDAMHGVFTGTTISTRFGAQRKNLASIVRGFKSSVTKQSREIHADFAWQTRFWDHIIRDDDEYERIKTYIDNNPASWERDQLNSIDN